MFIGATKKAKKTSSKEKIQEFRRPMYEGDSVLFEGVVWYITKKNNVIGLINFNNSATGRFIPLSQLSLDDRKNNITDMVGRKVDIMYDWSGTK